MAGGTKRDQPGDLLHSRPTVMDGALAAGPAAPAPAAVPGEDFLPQPRKIAQRVAALPVTNGAQSGDGGRSTAVTAKQRALRETGHSASIAVDNPHYHK
jgi:hypothetical protein